MPFAKRIVEPQLLCRHAVPNDEGLLFEDLCSISNVALSRTLRQLSDLARHACSLFHELEVQIISTNQRVWALQNKIGRMQRAASGLDPKQEAVPVSNLDMESKLTSHYQAPSHLQRRMFNPSSRPPCVEELHRNAKQMLHALQRDQQLRQRANVQRRVTISISVAPPMPTFPSPRTLRRREQRSRHLRTVRTVVGLLEREEKPARDSEFQPVQRKLDKTRSSSPIKCCHFTPWSRKAIPPSDSITDMVSLGHRPKCPVPNIPSTLDKQTNWSKALPLPTPEERMKTDSQVISSCIIPINVSGVGFDREASVRCSLVHSQSVLQRRRKLRRRKTISGIPRRVQQEDSDESPVARERTVTVHTNPDISLCHEELSLSGRLNTKDSGCQTDDFLIAAPSRRRIRAQRGQGIPTSLSHSTGNIMSLPDASDTMFTAAKGGRLRSRSLPREGGRLIDDEHDDSDDEEMSPYEEEEFLPGPGERILKDEEESTDDQVMPEHQLVSLKCKQHGGSPNHAWVERGRSRLPRKVDMGSCEISSSSDTFSSPIHSISKTGVLSSQIDHKEDHQSSSGNWSGSSSTCPSQTSETIPPAASPPLTGSSHCDSELSLNTANNANDDPTGFTMDPEQLDKPQVRGHRASSFTSTGTDLLDDPSISTASDGEWNYPQHQYDKSCHLDFSPPRSREEHSGLECPSFTSVATYESLMDKPPSEKADSSSHYSDTEGYYTSMHFNCGLKGRRSYIHNYAAMDSESSQGITVGPSNNEFCQPEYTGHRTLERHGLSIKKPKVKPEPPKRSSSLRKIRCSGNAFDMNEPKINSGQQLPLSSREMKLQLDLTGSPGQSEDPTASEEAADAWTRENTGEMTDSTLFAATDTQSFKDEGAVQSDYADLWLLGDLKSSDPYRSLSNSSSATGTVIECTKSAESSESQISQSGSRATSPSLPSVEIEFKLASPEKLAGLASPSSGYSSQSETPTSSFPSAFFPGPISPTSGKRKPKVPERKSSLSSLHQQFSREGSTSSKRDLELPIIPPTHLDLSALHNVLSKPSAHRNQMYILHQNKQKVAAAAAAAEARAANMRIAFAARASAADSSEIPNSATVAPTALCSVQLRPTGKSIWQNQDQPSNDAAARPKCPPVTVITPSSENRSPEFTKPILFKSSDPSSQDHCQTLFTPDDRPSVMDVAYRENVEHRQDRHPPGPMWAMTPFRIPSNLSFTEDDPLFQLEVQQLENDTEGGQDNEEMLDASCTKKVEEQEGDYLSGLPPRDVLEKDLNEATSLEMMEFPRLTLAKVDSPPANKSKFESGPCNTLDQVPVISYQSETSQAYTINNTSSREEEYETSGVPTKSASLDSREEGSTPDTEDYFSKDSTPSDNSLSPLNDETKTEDDSVFLSPNKLRTTEDLFAMIHRSKRKVLGRRDSGETIVRNRPSTASSTPATSPSIPMSPATPTCPQRAPGPIYRCAKKSTTSNEEFKLLLLKKGSRSDSSYRMSAAEILKSPIAPKSLGDLATEVARQQDETPTPLQQSPSGSEQLVGPFPTANTEGFSPKGFSVSGSSRQGRSRVPPAASSSRYGMRSRLYTAPMQAISEGETENSDGSPHDDRSSQGSS
ncbi:Nance-Horan syndrome protein-like isoform X3 [Arapaima gigas]